MDTTRTVELTHSEARAIVAAMKRYDLHFDACDLAGFWPALRKVRDARRDMDAVFAPSPDTPELAADIFAAGEAA